MLRIGIILSLVCTLFINTYGQQVAGHWYGVGIVQTPRQSNSYLSELVLRQQGTRVWGEFIYYFKDSVLTVPIKGQYDKSVRTVHLNYFPLVYYQSMSASRGLYINMQGYFRLVASKTVSSLQGILVSNAQYRYLVPDINFKLVKSNDTLPYVPEPEIIEAPKEKRIQVYKNMPAQPPSVKPVIPVPPAPIPDKKDTIAITAPVIVSPKRNEEVTAMNARPKEFSQFLEVEHDVIRLEMYDNGQIDGDSVSLFLNNQLLLDKCMLDIVPQKANIRIDTSLPYNELSMFAHNLGNFPPNSALLVIWDGKKRYEIFLNSDLNKTATLRIRKKKIP
ncbi:MAG: hypothetical protein FGM61_05155 [Sediminibacterium sp.]|nr:hypothetical protein [Sediminibacterium sp.]